jgi:NAD(P)-dependent dehydrogenase (short-subunit alcohol dehydrogenase family)
MTHSIVVGGTRGLGRVVVRQLAARGDAVSVIGRSEVAAADLESGNVRGYIADIADPAAVSSALADAIRDHGKAHYCIFLQRYRGKGDDWAGELEVTLTATKRIVEQLTPDFAEEGDRGLVMVSSVFGTWVGAGQSISYHVAKAGLNQMMRFYALDLAARGIRVNAVTTFTFLKEESKSFYLNNAPLLELYQTIVPMGRMATTEDSARVIEFLCSAQAGFVTGQNIAVDGGLSLVWPETMARRLKEL